jgi:hypothetical protein
MYYFKTIKTSSFSKKNYPSYSRQLTINVKPARFPANYKLNAFMHSVKGANTQTTDLVLNFKRLRFFPLARPKYSGETIFTTSLGCLAKFINKGKSHTKKKAVFLLVAVLLRRILLYSGLADMHLIINRMPYYFQEILNYIHAPSKSLYYHPFISKKLIDESSDKVKTFDFKYVSFTNTKSYGYTKWKRKGRLKRKISKRVYSINRVID